MTENNSTAHQMTTKFDVSKIDHRRIEKFRPKLEGFGGMQIVYALPNFPDRVAKIEAWDLLLAVEARHFTFLNAKDELEEVTQKNDAFAQLVSYFGESHTLFQRTSLLKVPISHEFVLEIKQQFGAKLSLPDDLMDFSANEVWSIVTLQEKSDVLKDPKRFSFYAGYSEIEQELSESFLSTYSLVTFEAVFSADKIHSIDVDQLVKAHGHMESILVAATNDPELKTVLTDFTKQALRYVAETGNLIDLIAKDNVIFNTNDAGTWNYKLVDAQFPAMGHKMLTEASDILAKISRTEPLTKGEIIVLKNTLNCVRILNGLANWLGIEDRIQIVPSEAQEIDPRVLLKIIRNGSYA